MRIRNGGAFRTVTEKQYIEHFKSLGYVPVEEPKPTHDLDEMYKGNGWYEYEGKSYRKDDLLEVLGDA